MTLRARLTAAFLAVVLGPVLLGAVFVGVTVAAVGRSRALDRLDTASGEVRTAVGLRCRQLRSAAEVAALLDGAPPRQSAPVPSPGTAPGAGQPGDRPGTQPGTGQTGGTGADDRAGPVSQVVERQLATAVVVTTAAGVTTAAAGPLPPYPWVDCAAPGSDQAPPGQRVRAGGISARVEVHDTGGDVIGYVIAVDPVDGAMVSALASSAAAGVSVVGGGAALSTEGTATAAVVAVATGLRAGHTGETGNGRYVRRLDPEPGQPLTLALSIEPGTAPVLYLVLAGVVVAAGLLAVTTAWLLGRSTTRPLTELAAAVDKVAGGDLTARVPVRSHDEVGRLATTFNRMTREMRGYVQALTASRDQLRGQLGILGDTLSSTHDLHRILQVILQTATAATGAQAGVVLLVDPATGVLVGKCGEGLAGRGVAGDVAELRLRPGEGLLGTVAASGEPRRGRVSRDGPALAAAEPRCLTYVAVPFAAPAAGPTTGLEPDGEVPGGSAARGVLALYDRHGFDEFDDTDVVTLRTFAGQAAVALDNVRVHEEAQRLSLTDALTGLSNYRYLRESLRREVERASRFGHTLAVLVLDLDHFKEINDRYGHAAGDAVLAEFARRVRVEIREVDLAFRQGGEEFVVLLPETDRSGATAVAQRLGDALRRTPVLVVGHQHARPLRVPVTVSVGAAVYPTDGDSGMAVLEAADDALYAAKAAGRDTFRLAGSDGV